MSLADFKIVADIAESVAKIIGIFFAGVWVFNMYLRNMEHRPRVEFRLDIQFQKKIDKHWIIELIAEIENKGKVPHFIENFVFELKSINEQDAIIESTIDEDRKQLHFPNTLTKNRYMGRSRFFEIDPGIIEKYTYVTKVPVNAEMLLLEARYTYRGGWLNKLAYYLRFGNLYKPDYKCSTKITKAVPN